MEYVFKQLCPGSILNSHFLCLVEYRGMKFVWTFKTLPVNGGSKTQINYTRSCFFCFCFFSFLVVFDASYTIISVLLPKYHSVIVKINVDVMLTF